MNDEPLLPGPVDEIKKLAQVPADVRVNGVMGDADAAAHAAERALAAGVPREKVTELATASFERIFEQVAPDKRKRWFWNRRSAPTGSPQLSHRPPPPQLPRGD